MNPSDDISRVMEQARVRASALRQQAIRDFWSDVDEQASRALRAATRLAHSLRRHQSRRRLTEV